MNTIGLDDGLLYEARDMGMARSGSMHHADTVNSKNMMTQRPQWWRHYIGAIGELVFERYSGLMADRVTIGRGDEGSDFPGGIQVKSSDCGTRPNLLILESQWDRKPCRLYVLVWVQLHSRVAHLLGAITRERAQSIRTLVDHGRGPTWMVRWAQLEPVDLYLKSAVKPMPAQPMPKLAEDDLERLKEFIRSA